MERVMTNAIASQLPQWQPLVLNTVYYLLHCEKCSIAVCSTGGGV